MKKFSILIFFLIFTLLIPVVFAQESIGSSKLDPSSPLYFLKAVREKLEIKFAGTDKVRVLRRLEFAERRLREINSLITNHREDLVQPNLENFLLELNLIRPVQDKYLNPTVSDSLGHYMQVLVSIYGNLTDPKAKLGVRSTVFRLMEFNQVYYTNMIPALTSQVFPSQVSKFSLGCNLLTKESLDSSLNESEKQILNIRSERCNEMITSVFKYLQTVK